MCSFVVALNGAAAGCSSGGTEGLATDTQSTANAAPAPQRRQPNAARVRAPTSNAPIGAAAETPDAQRPAPEAPAAAVQRPVPGGTQAPDAGMPSAEPGASSKPDAGRPPASAADTNATMNADELCEVGVHGGNAPSPLTLSGVTFAHDPTMVEFEGTFYRFWTGDDIPVATSTDLRSWRSAPAVFRSGYPDWVRPWLASVPGQTFNFPWAPDVSSFGGQLHLYSSFSAKFGDNISCITHLTTTDPGVGNWTDHGTVICTEGNERYNAIDADVGIDRDGTPWLAFGSFWDGIMAFELDGTGQRAGTELTQLAWAREIEAPVLFYRCGYYYLFVTWGLCCPGTGRRVSDLTYRVVVGRSEEIMGPYVARDGTPMLEGGGTLMVQGDATFAAAGHSDVIVADDKIYHFYHAYRRSNGNAELRIVEMPFDREGWPVPAGP